MKARFGPAGNPEAFYEAGKKASLEMPEWLNGQGLTAYEYQCSRGANIKEETARAIGEKAAAYGVKLSVHAPYYISLGTEDATIAANTEEHLLKSLTVANWLGADRVVFHIGGVGGKGKNRGDALARAKRRLAEILRKAEDQNLNTALLAPETMGKQNQLGNLEEVLEFCQLADWLIPAVDFGHLHALTGGGYIFEAEYEAAFDKIVAALGKEKAANLHVHFSRLEFTQAGEKKHVTFADDGYGPPYEPFLKTVAQSGYAPRVICDSAGPQAKDAKIMQDFYLSLVN
ncbi:MAG: TIM barrel protein [Sporomusaceae bacterium]|jgi:deoxyribonuclease-4|nr:TIM barrel protein [Sporomusaceae bacterium]